MLFLQNDKRLLPLPAFGYLWDRLDPGKCLPSDEITLAFIWMRLMEVLL